MNATASLLQVEGLSVEVPTHSGYIRIVDNVSFEIARGETLGLVGESGSGKSLTSLAIMQLLSGKARIASGSIKLDGQELVGLSPAKMRAIRGNEIGMIFQEPMTALDPAYTVGDQIAEAVRVHSDVSGKEAWERAVTLLERVGIPSPERRAKDYPHHFSGGMRQRVVIAIALACSPKIVLADEPTTALDVTVQNQILDLLRDIQREDGIGILFISHDMGVIADICDRVSVMYAGQVVESAQVDELFARPQHPYTSALLAAMPRGRGHRLEPIPGTVPTFDQVPLGCRFAPRCRFATAECEQAPVELDFVFEEHEARCLFPTITRGV